MFRTSTAVLLVAAVLALSLPLVRAHADGPQGVEVQGRGPIHEAFAQPATTQPEPGPMAPQAPPAPVDELPPDQKPAGDNVQWVPGYWQWDDEKNEFLWVSGFWRQAPPGRTWIPGQYARMDKGWQWTAGYWSGGNQPQQLLPEPPAPVQAEPGTPPPFDDSIYVPGLWTYRDGRYRWRAAYYLDYRPGWIWHPAQYVWTPNGYVFVDGYWDYPLDQRGLLFAPVAIDPSLLAQPNWTYTPEYVVNCDFLPSALFVRPGWGHYYFGDYFGKGYAGRFTPWIDYRFGGRGYDPLFAYYRLGANAARWERNLRTVYDGRRTGGVVLPPRTWQQQQALVGKFAGEKTVTAASLRNVTPLTPLGKVDPKVARLRNVTATERGTLERQLAQTRDLGRQHREAEAHVIPNRAVEVPRHGGSTVVTPHPAVVTREEHHTTPAPRIEASHPAAPPHVVQPAPKRTAAAHPPARTAPAHHAASGGGHHH